jgi:hypothetical protein
MLEAERAERAERGFARIHKTLAECFIQQLRVFFFNAEHVLSRLEAARGSLEIVIAHLVA